MTTLGLPDVISEIRAILHAASDTPGADAHDALTDIEVRAARLMKMFRESAPVCNEVTARLNELVTPRVTPPDYDQYPGSVDDVAEVITEFIDGMDRDRHAPGLRALVAGRLRGIELEQAMARFRQTVEKVLNDVTTNHLHPALREAGVVNPEGFRVELHGKWQES